ncbi:helicase [Halarchaeum acidiphilum MH1-52-1]|uniref:Helicase n=1 Tax=Halarchaeum acidiphilum MH1-52-1 TaxID=1261545 RepID=U2YRT6_9EURY|nr:ATP-dependent DNA helicase [Halarchaeum acidiphilum]GAD51437.1 helicase [Halarchaeum acidiphilum MH1-52-1]
MSDADVGGETGTAWRERFGFDEPYDNQADAIEAAIDVGRENGYLAMEGACGTGKTMAALTAAATLCDAGVYENVLVVTPVKQQLRQFVDDLRTMNAGSDDPLRSVALVGKRDLCPYGREDVFPAEVGVHDRCEDLRETTAGLVEAGDEGSRYDGAEIDDLTAIRTDEDLDDAWWDPVTARDLAKSARPGRESIDQSTLETAGASSPYVPVQPSADAEFDADEPLFCPFEADWYGRNRGSPIDFTAGEERVVTSRDLLPAAVEAGTCPHRVQSVLLETADVIVGNYNHLFDPQSRPLLEGVVGEDTFVIVDEAHRIEERVRDLLSERVGRQTLRRARNDMSDLVARANQSESAKEELAAHLADFDVTVGDVKRARDFYDDVAAWLTGEVTQRLDEEFGSERDWPARDVELPLRDPDVAEPDDLTRWAEREGYTGDLWRRLRTVGTAVEDVLDEEERATVCEAVGSAFTNWWERDHATHFREIELEHAPKEAPSGEPWEATYTAGVVTYNCMPGEAVRDVFAALGGGVLMSATLEPIDVFREVVGLDALAGDGDESRPVAERSYDLPFPEENRASWTVAAEAFTARNRGEPTSENANATREQYRYVLRTLARSHGNVLVCMPNYREAAWAGDYLADAVDKEVLVDSSSSDEETERLKRAFFRGPGKVLVTSTRGTLTEGVDYDGDKLHCCAVVGVPLVNVASPRIRAVKRAYADAFGEANAFEYALTVPAVRRSRQAIGRVVRGRDERGVRVFVDERYTADAPRSVHDYLGAEERGEFVRMTPEFLGPKLDGFWQ